MNFYYDKEDKNKWLDEKKEGCGETNVEPNIYEEDRVIDYIYFDEDSNKWKPEYAQLKIFYSINDGSEIELQEKTNYVTEIKPPENFKAPFFEDGEWKDAAEESELQKELNKIVESVTVDFKGKKIFPSDSLVQLAYTGLTLMEKKNKDKGVLPIETEQIEVDSLEEARALMDELSYKNYIYHLKVSALNSRES